MKSISIDCSGLIQTILWLHHQCPSTCNFNHNTGVKEDCASGWRLTGEHTGFVGTALKTNVF